MNSKAVSTFYKQVRLIRSGRVPLFTDLRQHIIGPDIWKVYALPLGIVLFIYPFKRKQLPRIDGAWDVFGRE